MQPISPLMLPVIFNKLKKRLDNASVGMLKEYGLSKLHLLYMMVLYENQDGMTLKELSDHLDFDKANTSRAITQMTGKGYVQKKAQEEMERKFRLELTQKGRDIAARIWQQNRLANVEVLSLFTPEELAALSRIAEKLWGFLEKA
jgi:MarR family transcriptional regulator, organic hydroperoxide resistance regulator